MSFRTGSHCKYKLCFHVVFVTKFRRKVFDNSQLVFLEVILKQELEEVKCFLLEFNGEENHVHFIMETIPSVCLSSIIGRIRSKITLAMHKKFRYPCYWRKHKNRLWSVGFFIASCGGVTIERLKEYVQQQQRPYPP